MMAKGLITLLFCCSSYLSFGQETFLGKKLGISLGTSLALPIAPRRFFRTPGDDIRYFHDYAALPPKIDLDLQYAVNSRFNVVFNTELRGIQHTRFRFEERVYEQGVGGYEYSDVFIVRTNVLSNSLGIRLHTEYAPVGTYTQFRAGHSLAFSKVYPIMTESLESSSFNDEINYSDTLRLEPWTQKNSFIFTTVGIGNVFFISNDLALDFGAKTTFFFGRTERSYTYDPTQDNSNLDLKTTFESTVRDITKKNLSTSYLLEVYIKLSLFR